MIFILVKVQHTARLERLLLVSSHVHHHLEARQGFYTLDL